MDDDRQEPTETFTITLSSAVNATIGTAMADGTIIDNDEDDGNRADKASTKGRALLFEATTRAGRQGFVRVINHPDVVGEIQVEGIDDAGMRAGPADFSGRRGYGKAFQLGRF